MYPGGYLYYPGCMYNLKNSNIAQDDLKLQDRMAIKSFDLPATRAIYNLFTNASHESVSDSFEALLLQFLNILYTTVVHAPNPPFELLGHWCTRLGWWGQALQGYRNGAMGTSGGLDVNMIDQ